MRAVMVAIGLLAAVPAWGDGIGEVLRRSQEARLASLQQVAPDDARTRTIRASFDRLLRSESIGKPVELRVVDGPVVAECLLGRIVVVNAELAGWSEGERIFVLAHELGHVAAGHWANVGMLYHRHVPGPVAQSQTDAAAPQLTRELSALSQHQELEADAWGLRALQRLGYGLDAALATFLREGVQRPTPTHPGTQQRVAHLRSLAPP